MREIKALTGIRGLAAALVVCYHTMWVSTFKNGYLAVDMFFILSGFIMMTVYCDKFKDAVNGTEYALFMWNRVARIYPVYALITLITVLIAFFSGESFDIKRIAVNLSMLQSVGISDSIVGPSWSISVEFIAYLTFPMIALITLRSQPARIMLLSLVIWFYYQLATTPLYTKHGVLNVSQYYLNGPIIRGFCGFYLGVTIFFLRDIASGLNKTIISIGQAIIFFGIIYCLLNRGLAIEYISLCALFILSLYANEDGIMAKVMAWNPIFFLGKISLSLYLVHLLVVMAVNPIKFRYPLYVFNPKVDPGVIILIVSILVSAVLYKYVELPARERLKMIGRKAYKEAAINS
ncbi:acyltransferase [Enterobacter kobei]|uniref:acyltransferase family protein n=1 Tax=Enterobacter kobei TaxID=208224 RepID=UPI002FD27D02